MTARFRQDLNAGLEGLRQAHLITGQTLRRWSQLARDGFGDFVQARGTQDTLTSLNNSYKLDSKRPRP